MSNSTQNLGYSGVKDNFYDSKLMVGLINSGVFPSSFRVLRGSAILSGADASAVPILASSGEQIRLSSGLQIVTASVVTLSGTVVSAVDLGVSASPGISPTQLLVDGALQNAAPSIVGAGVPYLSMDVTGGAASAELQVVLVVV